MKRFREMYQWIGLMVLIVAVIVAFFLLWLYTSWMRLLYGACEDPECDGWLGELTSKLDPSEQGIVATRRCTECGMSNSEFVSFEAIEREVRMQSQAFS